MSRRTPLACVLAMLLTATVRSADLDEITLPVIESAGTDGRGRIIVNGEPFFPILMYDVPTDPESLTMFREHGFNVLSATVDDGERLRKHGLYVAAHAAETNGKNLDGVLFGIGMDSPALNWPEGLHEKTRDDVAKMKSLFPRRPIFHAIGYWENEPAGVFENQLSSKAKYEELIALLDIPAPYLYPLPYQPVKTVGNALQRADAVKMGRQPLLPVLQLFTWKPDDKFPTPDELRCMTYLALIHGADGIGYYSYNYVTGKTGTNIAKEEPELWASVKDLNRELRALTSALLHGEPDHQTKVLADRAAVVWRAIQLADDHICLLANVSNRPQTVGLTWEPGIKKILRRSGSELVPLTENLMLKPFESLTLIGRTQ